MYKDFYGFAHYPFEISPDPSFFCGTSRHNEALASLYYGVQRRKGFIIVTGEVGTGKTLLARCLFSLLDRDRVTSAYVFNPLLNPVEFLQYAMADLGMRVEGRSKVELLFDLNRLLIAEYRRNSTVALVVDEAHLLSCEVLEEIRLFTNLETGRQKLLQIVLIGQPELEQKIDSPQLCQLKQRVAQRCRLDPLSEAETRKYILRRLTLAGADGRAESIFPDASLSLIYDFSRGTPRLINTICENALINGFAAQDPCIGPEIISEVAADLCLPGQRKTPAEAADFVKQPMANSA